jgi:hypothetical protein
MAATMEDQIMIWYKYYMIIRKRKLQKYETYRRTN